MIKPVVNGSIATPRWFTGVSPQPLTPCRCQSLTTTTHRSSDSLCRSVSLACGVAAAATHTTHTTAAFSSSYHCRRSPSYRGIVFKRTVISVSLVFRVTSPQRRAIVTFQTSLVSPVLSCVLVHTRASALVCSGGSKREAMQ